MTKITIYSTRTCGYCKALKSYLSERNIEYEEKMADQSQELAAELYRLSGQLGVPFTIITKDDGGEEKVLGFDRPKINDILGIN